MSHDNNPKSKNIKGMFWLNPFDNFWGWTSRQSFNNAGLEGIPEKLLVQVQDLIDVTTNKFTKLFLKTFLLPDMKVQLQKILGLYEKASDFLSGIHKEYEYERVHTNSARKIAEYPEFNAIYAISMNGSDVNSIKSVPIIIKDSDSKGRNIFDRLPALPKNIQNQNINNIKEKISSMKHIHAQGNGLIFQDKYNSWLMISTKQNNPAKGNLKLYPLKVGLKV